MVASDLQDAAVCDVTEVLEKFRKYQYVQYVLLCLSTVAVSMIHVNFIFAAGDLNYRCMIPECEAPNSTYDAAWWNNASSNTSVDRCSKPLLRADHTLGSQCTNESFTGLSEPCQEWLYESNNTVVAELNLACQPWLINLIGTIHSVGMLVSMIVCGWMCDRFGRKSTLIFTVVSSVVGLLKTIATSYYMYLGIEFCEAVVTGGHYGAAMMLMLEMCGRDNRIMSGVVFAYAIYLGEVVYAVIAMFVPFWKTLIFIINGPCILFIFYAFLVRESPRWQIISGNTEQAKETLLTVAKMNKINVNRQELAGFDEIKLKNKFNIGANETVEGLRRILSSKEIVKRSLVAAVCQFTAGFVYFGMMINSVFLPGNKYTNFLLSTVMSFPGELISYYCMNKIGRKMTLIVGFLMSGIFCVAMGHVPTTYRWAKIVLFLLGKMLISVCFTGTFVYAMELFPTSARGFLLGFGSFASRVGGVLAPLTPILTAISKTVPSILFGCSAILSAVLLTLTPETKNLPLMETIRHVEESVKAAKEKRNKKAKSTEAEVEHPLMSSRMS